MNNFTSSILFSTLIFLTSLTAQADSKIANPLYNVTVAETEIIGQFHGDPYNADLRIYMAGNQFVVMDQLVSAFKLQNPEIKNIFYVTLPPGKELKWILAGGIEIHGENSKEATGFQLRVLPDVYTTVNKGHMDQLANAGYIKKYHTYAHNRLVLMVKANDPLANTSIDAQQFYNLMSDSTTTISEPDILTQGIERHIWQMYTDTSKTLFANDTNIQSLDGKMFNPAQLGDDPVNSLRRNVYFDKVLTGNTLLTSIHHLETPANIRSGKTRLGPVWVTEINYQQNRLGKQDISMTELNAIGLDGKYLDRREKVNYLAARIKSKNNPFESNKKAAKKWIEFLNSETAQALFEQAGFIRSTPNERLTPFTYQD